MENCSSLRLAWKMTSDGIAILPKQRQLVAWHVSSEGDTGLGRKSFSRNSGTTIWSSYTRGVSPSRTLLASHWRFNASGPGERLRAWKKSKAVSWGNGLSLKSKHL